MPILQLFLCLKRLEVTTRFVSGASRMMKNHDGFRMCYYCRWVERTVEREERTHIVVRCPGTPAD